jgi:hypothetical protein
MPGSGYQKCQGQGRSGPQHWLEQREYGPTCANQNQQAGKFGRHMQRNTQAECASQQQYPGQAGSADPDFVWSVKEQAAVLDNILRIDKMNIGIIHREFPCRWKQEQRSKANQHSCND